MNDTIPIRIMELISGQPRWTEYALTYEELEFVQKSVLIDKKGKICTDSPENIGNIIMQSMFNQQRKSILYNLKEMPQNRTLEEVENHFNKTGFLLVDGDNIQTKQII